MTRVAGIVFLDVLACAHDPALGRHGPTAVTNVSTAQSPGPHSDPLARASVDTPVKELERDVGGATVTVGNDLTPGGRSIQVPVSQDRSKALRDALLANATGLRRP